MSDLDRLMSLLYQLLLNQERIHSEEISEYWNRLCRNPLDRRAAAGYYAAVANWYDFLSLRDKITQTLDCFLGRW